MSEPIKVYCIRVLEVEFDGDDFSYHQMETNERFGPFPSLTSRTAIIHDRMVEDIAEAIQRQYH
jgi:hypothetical protein